MGILINSNTLIQQYGKRLGPQKAVVAKVAHVLKRLIRSNSINRVTCNDKHITIFHALEPPKIDVQQYLERIVKYSLCSEECFILALIYIDRLIQESQIILSELTVHRICITANMLAAKFLEQSHCNNDYYAKIGGIELSELNKLEVEFLFRTKFSLHVTEEVFFNYRREINQCAPTSEFDFAGKRYALAI